MARPSSKKSIFCFIFIFYVVSSNVIPAATNGEVTLKVQMKGQIDEVLWKHEGNKMVEMDNKAAEPVEYLTFKGRTVLDKTTGDVTIQKLSKADSGEYEAEVVFEGRLKTISHKVVVYDPVSEAKITCKSSGTKTTLYCEAKGDLLRYRWSGLGIQTEMENQTGPEISKEKDQDYTCLVKNPVSNTIVVYQAGDCFDSGHLHVVIGVCSAVVAVAVVAGLGFYCYKIKSAGSKPITQIKEEEEAENEELLSNVQSNVRSKVNQFEEMTKGGTTPAQGKTEQSNKGHNTSKPETYKHSDPSPGSPKQSGYTVGFSNDAGFSGDGTGEGTGKQVVKDVNTEVEEQNQPCDPSLPDTAETPQGGEPEDEIPGVTQTSDHPITSATQSTHNQSSNPTESGTTTSAQCKTQIDKENTSGVTQASEDKTATNSTHGQFSNTGEDTVVSVQSTNNSPEEIVAVNRNTEAQDNNVESTGLNTTKTETETPLDSLTSSGNTPQPHVGQTEETGGGDQSGGTQTSEEDQSDNQAVCSATSVTADKREAAVDVQTQKSKSEKKAADNDGQSSGHENVERTHEHEENVNTETDDQNQFTDPSMSGLEESISSNGNTPEPHGKQKEETEGGDHSGGTQTSEEDQLDNQAVSSATLVTDESAATVVVKNQINYFEKKAWTTNQN